MIILVLAGAIAAWFGLREGARRSAIAGAVLVALALAVAGLERIVVTPGEHAETTVRAFVDRAVAGDADAMLALVAPDATIHFVRAENPGLGIDVIEQGARMLERRYRVRSNSITKLRGTTTRDGTGEVVLACLTDVDGGYAGTPHGWTIEVAERDGSWRIIRLVFRSVAGRDPSLRMLGR